MSLTASVMGVAFAAVETVPTPNSGTITINNAAIGETYKIYKLFNAEVGANGAIVYTGTIPDSDPDLTEYFEENADGNIVLKSGVDEEALFADMAEWADGQASDNGHQQASSSMVQFTGLSFGYYVITSTQGKGTNSRGSAIMITSTKPDGVVNEKNTSTPVPTKTVDGTEFSIGDTITYTLKFSGANYQGADTSAKIVTSYQVYDTLPAFLDNVTVQSITVKTDPEEELDVVQFTGTPKMINIPWADYNNSTGKWTSKYPNMTEVEIVYTAVLTDVVRIGANNTNEMTLKRKTGNNDGTETPTEEDWHSTISIKTYGAALKKVDGEGNELAGAKFKISGIKANEVGTGTGIYVVETTTATAAQETEFEVNSNGYLYILGLKSGLTLSATETEAPTGYNKISGTFNIPTKQLSSEVKANNKIPVPARGRHGEGLWLNQPWLVVLELFFLFSRFILFFSRFYPKDKVVDGFFIPSCGAKAQNDSRRFLHICGIVPPFLLSISL